MTRRLAYMVLIVGIGLYSLGISALGKMAFDYGYRPEAHSLIMLIRYLQPILVFPLFLVSLLPRKWTTLPLWLVCLSISVLPFMIRDAKEKLFLGYWDTPFGLREVKEIAIVMLIPVVVQMAVWLKPEPTAQKPEQGLLAR
jgi:hypothetical protein